MCTRLFMEEVLLVMGTGAIVGRLRLADVDTTNGLGLGTLSSFFNDVWFLCS